MTVPAIPTGTLDNTPYTYQGKRTGVGQRCDPFGYETGDIRVLGGIADPRREKYVWQCKNMADGRYRVSCANGHTGMIMYLCRGHVYQFTARMNGLCPACSHPPAAREIEEAIDSAMREIPLSVGERRRSLIARVENLRHEMNELLTRGVIRTGAPLRLQEVS